MRKMNLGLLAEAAGMLLNIVGWTMDIFILRLIGLIVYILGATMVTNQIKKSNNDKRNNKIPDGGE